MMETNRAKDIIIKILQESLKGHLDSSSNLNPGFIADAISAKVDFEKEYTIRNNDRIVETLITKIKELEVDMEEEMSILPDDERLLRNYIKGKLIAYKEILDIIKKLWNIQYKNLEIKDL